MVKKLLRVKFFIGFGGKLEFEVHKFQFHQMRRFKRVRLKLSDAVPNGRTRD
jgi:hypothetical protein